MSKIMEYSAFKESRRRKKRNSRRIAAVFAALILSVLFLRAALIALGFPNGDMLEHLARQVQCTGYSITEAVSVFCWEVLDGTP